MLDVARGADLMVIEGPSYGSGTKGRQTGHHERAGAWWLLLDALDRAGLPVAVASPAAVKRYATGKGNAPKDAVLAAVVRRFPEYELTSNDEADALVLCAMGCDHLGAPIVTVPTAHRLALASVEWPDPLPVVGAS